MNYQKSQLSEKRIALNKGIADLFNLLDTIESGPSSDDTYTDEDGNTIKLSTDIFGDKDEYASLSLEISQGNSVIIVSLTEPKEQLLSELKTKGLLNDAIKKK